MNGGYEDDELKPYQEPEPDFNDERRIEIMLSMGFKRKDIDDSLRNHKYDDPYATYLLLGRRAQDVSVDISRDCPVDCENGPLLNLSCSFVCWCDCSSVSGSVSMFSITECF